MMRGRTGAVAAGVLWALLSMTILWLGGDIAYSRVVEQNLRRWETGVERDDTGVRLGCREYTAGSGETAILMIHGFGDSPAIFREMAQTLADRQFTCRVMRLPGFAEPMEAYAATTGDKWVAAVGEETEALRARHSSIWLVGHSLGGTLAMHALLESPEEVEGAIVIAPLLGVSNKRSPVLPTRTWHTLGSVFLQFSSVIENYLPPDAAGPEALTHHERDRFIPAVVYQDMFSLMDEVNPRAGELDKPLLMFVSRDDAVTDFRSAENFFRRVPAERKRLVHVENSSHDIPVDVGWENVTDVIEGFVRRQGPPISQVGDWARKVAGACPEAAPTRSQSKGTMRIR